MTNLDEWRTWDGEQQKALLNAAAERVRALRWDTWHPYSWQVPPAEVPSHGLWLMLGGRGTGKALRYDTPMPTPLTTCLATPTGWTTMGALSVGSHLFDEQGKPCTITATYDVPASNAYRVRFSDGTHLDASGDHLWITLDRAARRALAREGKPISPGWATGRHTLTTEQVLSTLTAGDRRPDLNHCVPLAMPLRTPEARLPIDPWLLGYWLGNGSLHGGRLTTHPDDEQWVRARIGRRSNPTHTADASAAPSFTVPGLIGDLRALGVLDNKHVPAAYLRASERQRWDLLAGLLDSDGHQAPNGSVEFGSKDRPLADAVLELARSLGIKATLKTGTATLYGTPMGVRYRVTWRAAQSCPFQSPRKADRWPGPSVAQGQRNLHRMIIAVDPITPEPMRCIAVDSPNRLFLAGEGMIPTHNTDGCARYMVEHVNGPPCDPRVRGGHRMSIIAPTLGDAGESCVNGPSGLRAHDPTCRIRGGIGGGHVVWPNGAEARLFGAYTPEDVERLRSGGNRSVPLGTLVRTETGPRPIEQVQVGDRVWTEDGLRSVLRNMDHGVRPLVHVVHTAGVLTCTPDHEVWVCGTGWVQAQHLRPGGNLTVWSTAGTAGSGSATTGDAPAGASPTATAPPSCCTVGSTNSTTARYRPAPTSTTPTTTATTTPPRTWSYAPPPSTSPNTQATAAPTGTQQAAGPANAGHRNPSPPACTAPSPSSAEAPPTAASPAGAQHSGWRPAPCGHASCVAASGSHPAAAPPSLVHAAVVMVSPGPAAAPVRDLTVAGTHTFIASGVLVSNCLIWLEEVAAMRHLGPALQHSAFGLRVGPRPHYIGSTTPKPRPEIRALLAQPTTIVSRGRTRDAIHLDPTVRQALEDAYAGTRIGRQELDGEVLDDVEGALWTLSMIDRDRIVVKNLPPLTRVVVAIDPAVTSGEDSDETGIIVAGIDVHGHVYILEDLTCRSTPQEWVRTAQQAYTEYGADRIVAEANNGGDMVEAILRAQGGQATAYKKVTASRGKRVRAEPISALYEQHRVHHVGTMRLLEDQMTSWVPIVTDKSPDRLDALVWAVTELAVEPQRKKGAWSL